MESQIKNSKIKNLRKIRKQFESLKSECYEIQHNLVETTRYRAYALVGMCIDNVIDHYDTDFIIRDLTYLELSQVHARHLKDLIIDIQKIDYEISKNVKKLSPESTMRMAYNMVFDCIESLVDHYDPDWKIREEIEREREMLIDRMLGSK